MLQEVWSWDGTGTSADPYQIKNSADWLQLSRDVSGGESYSGKFFEMKADVDAKGFSIGTVEHPFSGTFSGGMYTLTYNRGYSTAEHLEFVNDYCAPFIRLDGATIRDLKVTGRIFSNYQFAAGIASVIDGTEATTISSCYVSTEMWAGLSLSSDASFGGIVGTVTPVCTASPTIQNCTFTGLITGYSTRSGGMVGYANIAVVLDHCLFDPVPDIASDECATFVRMKPGVECTFKECYFTSTMGTKQGEAVFREVEVPDGCTYRFVSEPQAPFNGVDYYKSGTVIELTAPDGVAFDHWTSDIDGCWLSNPWQRSGLQTVRDIKRKPIIQIATSMPEAKQERTMDGTRYRYLYNFDYHLYLSDEEIAQKSYHFDEHGELFKWDKDGNHVWITAVVGWADGKIPSDGAQIHNDLSGVGRDYTLLGAIAPQAFKGCSELKTLYFKDTDANIYNAQFPFDFVIGDKAFADCPNLTEIKMMQYTTEGDNHWEALSPEQVTYVSDSVFAGSPQAYFTVDASKYQDFLSSQTWKKVNNRILVYNHTVVDMDVNGARYSEMRNTKGESLKNDAEGHNQLMETLRYWNADYQQFTASSLLTTVDENIWYTKVVGVDAGSLSDGTMRIYNDPGSYYNYKTIALESLGESKDVKAIEFWQTNGRSENSFTDLKMVIRNGALKGCDNLKEIRLFYYVQDGDDHWEALGPQDVIPGDDIFGIKTFKDPEDDNLVKAYANMNKVRFVVSTSRFQEFMDDPNWAPYLAHLEPQDGPDTEVRPDFTKAGVTYGYMSNPGGIMQTSQTVSQDVSWWTLPRIAIEVALTAASIYDNWASFTEQSKQVKSQIENLVKPITEDLDYIEPYLTNKRNMFKLAQSIWGDRGINDFEKAKEFILSFSDIGADELFGEDNPFLRAIVKAGDGFRLGEKERMAEGLAHMSEGQIQSLCISYQTVVLDAQTKIDAIVKPYQEKIGKALLELPFSVTGNRTSATVSTAATEYLNTLSPMSRIITPGKGLPGALFGTIGANAILAQNLYGSGNYDSEGMRQGMRQNILSNIHQVGLVGGGYIITTPAKNLAYHTYIKNVPDQETVTLYTGTDEGGLYANTTTAAIAKNAFHGKSNVRTVRFYESEVTTNEAVPMVLVLPDSVFAGTNVNTLDLRLQTKSNGTQAMGPEGFILAGSNTFAGVDTLNFHIIIDPSRKDDFLFNESWAPMEQCFVYEQAVPQTQHAEYGSRYAYVYENGSVQKVHKVSGHKIEHTIVTEPDEPFLDRHGGAVKLCNDIGVWNNYQLDAVGTKAFYGNKKVNTVNFTDLPDMNSGECYTGLDMTLRDSCFANSSLSYLEMLYLVTGGTNHIDAITPQQVKIGQGVFDGTSAMIKMMPQQVAWFEADSSWVKYKDRFMPCIIQPTDKGFKKVLKDVVYYDHAHTDGDAATWSDYADLSRIADQGFSWLNGKFTEQKDDILSLADFKHFESVGLTSIYTGWFKGLTKMANILLPSTLREIHEDAFNGCSSLQEIELPAKVSEIGSEAFANCAALKSIVVRNPEPASLGGNVFPKNDGMKIYVPAGSLNAYLASWAWAEYKDYIVSDDTYHTNKVVTLDVAGTLANKLGLSVEWNYTGIVAGDEPYLLHGPYAKYDSLTVSGPLNDLDLWVIRYLGGNNGYESGGKATDGRLRYLNLYDASIKKDKDCKAHYRCVGSTSWQSIDKDNVLPRDLFRNCTAFETVILPKSLTSITSGIFEGCPALARVAVTGAVKEYDGWNYTSHLFSNPVQELVLLTDQHATTSAKNPWGASLQNVYTLQSQIGDYMNDAALTTMSQSILATFKDDAVMRLLADKGEFFPSEYLIRESVEGIFSNSDIEDFDDFDNFQYVERLDDTFSGNARMKRITLPTSVGNISSTAFAGCSKLDTIRIVSILPAELAEDAFADLPEDFRILVPRRYAKLYRTQWAQYADHINVDETYKGNRDILTVTVTEPNTLAQALGLEAELGAAAGMLTESFLKGVRGDYSHISRLKVVGPIGAVDIDLLKYLSGYTAWIQSRNYAGRLQYLDLYDAQLKETDEGCYVLGEYKRWAGDVVPTGYLVKDNKLPRHSFLRAYNLKTLILPKTCKEVEERALQECEGMETLVLGDDMENFNWNALDDDAMLTRMYILAKKKPEISTEWAIWRWLCNNYNPTFDAFYVRPSQYQSYLLDEAYTGQSWQRTNNISKGVFDDDESFCAFASHGAATPDELASVTSVKGWFDSHSGVRNLLPLRYTYVDYIDKATLAPLTQLEQIAMPVSLFEMEEGLFEKARHLRSVDFLMCDSTDVVAGLRDGGLARLGINTQQTLAYVPGTYGETTETNVVVNQGGTLKTKTYRIVDSLDYVVPYEFEAEQVENPRALAASSIPYTFCVPYKLNVPSYARAYKLSARDGNSLVFEEVTGELEAMQPYLLKVVGNKRLRKMSTTLNTSIAQTIPATGPMTYGHQMDALGYTIRGTFVGISNAQAAEYGAYILQSDGDWHPVSTDSPKAEVLPFRAYLLPSARNARGNIRMALEDATDIDNIETIDHDGTRRYYDLNGRELPGKPAQRGIYIHNGKKVMMK